MATNRPQMPIGPVLQALFARDDGSLTDGQLLQRYLNRSDQAAFAILVRRHGPMVLGVCRRILGNFADAEDAFQAVFLVLARKSQALASHSAVGAWLHGVARHTALKARAAAAIRGAKEQAAARPLTECQEAQNDWLPRLDAELSRLPRKYRAVIVACDLEGKTRQQAARQLSLPEGTVASRLARGRALLAKRLLRGAQVVSATLVTGSAAKAALPAELVHSTIQAAALVAAGNRTAEGVLSAAALTLAKGVMRTMFWNKVRIAGVLLVIAVVIAGVGGRAVRMLAAQEKLTPQAGEKAGQAKVEQVKDNKTVEEAERQPVAPKAEAPPAGAANNGEQKTTIHIIEQPGHVVPFEQVDVYARITGYVGQVSVDIGDHVKKGQLLAKLEVPELEQQLNLKKAMVRQAEGAVAQAKGASLVAAAAIVRTRAQLEEAKAALLKCHAEIERWQTELSRAQKLRGQGVFDKQTEDEIANQFNSVKAAEQLAKAKVAEAEAVQNEAVAHRDKGDADIETARAALQVAQADASQTTALLQFSQLIAPFDGVVIRRNVNTGTLAGPSPIGKSEPLFTLARIDRMRIVVQVPELDAVHVASGMKAALSFRAIQGKEFTASVTRTAGALDPASRTLRVEIDLANPEGRLLPGMYAEVVLTPNAVEPKKKQ